MFRYFAMLIAGMCLTAAATAQTRPIQWVSNTGAGVSQAQRLGLPMMLYVAGGGDDDDMKDAQQVAFRDPLVGGIARERFVTIRLPQSSQTTRFLEELGASSGPGNSVLFVSPEMKLLGSVPPGEVADAKTLARRMTGAFREFRKDLFTRELKPKLESAETSVSEIIATLRKIKKMLILEADESVVQLLKQGGHNRNVQKQAYDVLAALSTPKCVEALLEAAPGEKLAEQALGRCEACVAEDLLTALSGDDFERSVIAYEALVKVCRLGGKKPRGFWEGQNQNLIDEELDRVEKGARRAAERWKQKYEAYR